MQKLMLRLDRFVRRRRTPILLLWLVTFIAAVPFAMQQSDNLTGGGFGVPGSQSEQVEALLEAQYPDARNSFFGAVLVPRKGADAADFAAAITRVGGAARKADDVELAPAARAAALAATTRDQSKPVIVPLAVTVDDQGTTDVATDLRESLGIADQRESAPVGFHLVGQGALWASLQNLSQDDLARSESVGFPIVLLILLGVFGSLAAAALPLLLGVVSVLMTGALIFFLSQVLEMSVFVTNMASMIGIGVAVDYSLFVLARYREEVHAGREPEEARSVALATSGVAVLFSGLTVIVSLAGLFIIPTNSLRSMALGAILVVAVSMIAAATFLPAMISLLGHRAHARGRLFTIAGLVARSWRRRRPGSTRPEVEPGPGFWLRWTGFVTRRPVVAVVAAASLLLVLAIPALSLQTGNGALQQFPEGHETRVGVAAAASLGGAGDTAPLRVVVPTADAAAAGRNVAADPEIVRVTEPIPSRDGSRAMLLAFPRHDGESKQAKAAVARIRAAHPQALVGGSTALQKDFGDTVAGSMWKIVLFVLGLSYLVLMVLLRSVILPLKAVIMNLLSVGAAYGVLVAVFQWGWIDGFLGFESPGHIETITPPLVLAVVFGLSMDYEVFLLSRIKERFAATGDTKLAVAQGLASSARTITSAALIMVAVFAVFVSTGVPSIKQLGLGNAVAIAVDATLVRLVLVPAAMELFGDWNWWMPRRLARMIPEASFEELPAGAVAAAR